MTPEQARAARGLIDLTQTDLAKRAGLSLSTVVDFERERRIVSDDAIEAMRKALEKMGVEFIEPARGKGHGVRLTAPKARQTTLDV